MEQKHLELINKILDLPVVSDLCHFEFVLKCNSNGIRSWEVQFKYTAPSEEKTYKQDSNFYLQNEMGDDSLEFVLKGLLGEIAKDKESE